MNPLPLITSLDDIQGKTIRAVAADYDGVILIFDDGFICLRPETGYYGDVMGIIASKEFDLAADPHLAARLKLASNEHIAALVKAKQDRQAAEREEQERRQYEALRRKFENRS